MGLRIFRQIDDKIFLLRLGGSAARLGGAVAWRRGDLAARLRGGAPRRAAPQHGALARQR